MNEHQMKNTSKNSSNSSKIGRKTYKIVLLGNPKTGKTSIIQKFANNTYPQAYNSTVGVDFVSKNVLYNNNTYRLQLWDTSGMEKYKCLIPAYLRDASCVVFVFDVSDPESLLSITQWVNLLKSIQKDKVMSLICGSKADLEKNFDDQKLQELIEKYKMKAFQMVSAKTGENIEKLFNVIIDMFIKKQLSNIDKIKAERNSQNGSKNSKKDEQQDAQQDGIIPQTTQRLKIETKSQKTASTVKERQQEQIIKNYKTKKMRICRFLYCCPF